MTISSAGSLTSTTGTALTSLAVTATAANDLWVVCVIVKNATITTTGVSSALSSNWTNVTGNWLDGGSAQESIWIGHMTGPGTDTLNFTFSGSMAGVGIDIDAHPFHSTVVNPAWTVDSFGFQANVSSTTVSFPPLTAKLGELYWGHARVPTSANTPAPAGFIFNPDANGNPEMYNPSVVYGLVSPTLQQAAGTSQTIAILVNDHAGPTLKESNTQAGTDVGCTFTLAAAPSIGDLMVAVLAVDTPTTIHAPTIFTTNVVDTWVPVLGTQDTQQRGANGLRLTVFYKTANATDATQTQFTFAFPPMTDTSQGGLPQFPTTDFAGVLVTFESPGAGSVGFDTGSPQNYPPNGNLSTFNLPSINTKGAVDTFLSVLATLGQPSISHTDPAAASLASAVCTSPAYGSQPFTVALWSSTAQSTSYPFAFKTNNPNPNGDVLAALLGIRTATNFYYNGPFVRMGYPYEGPDQRLLLRYPYHWAYTTLITAGVPLIGQFFSQDQLAAADRYYMGKTLLTPSSDFNLILSSGIGGDFNPV
jgi:hypothetical protein